MFPCQGLPKRGDSVIDQQRPYSQKGGEAGVPSCRRLTSLISPLGDISN